MIPFHIIYIYIYLFLFFFAIALFNGSLSSGTVAVFQAPSESKQQFPKKGAILIRKNHMFSNVYKVGPPNAIFVGL